MMKIGTIGACLDDETGKLWEIVEILENTLMIKKLDDAKIRHIDVVDFWPLF